MDATTLYPSIARRKSCRQYTGQPLPEARLAEISRAIEGFDSLYPDAPVTHRFVSETKGMFHAEAPHYLVISGQGKPGELENTGFLYQQLALWFDANELGCVWLGQAKAPGKSDGKHIVAMAFGQAAGSPHRQLAEFKRKPIDEVASDPKDERVQAVHLAPSGMNLQPWYLEKRGDGALLYRQKQKGPISLLYKLTDLDMGIALCHYALACGHLGKGFAFHRTDSGPAKEGCHLFGEISEP